MNITDLDAAWRDYADRIKAAGERITGAGFPTDPRLRAEGYRYVSRLTNLAHQIYVEFDDPERPMLFRYGDDLTPFGATNTDNNYYRTMIDPAGTYRISGKVAGVKELLVSVHDGEFVYGKTAVLGELSLGELEVTADGVLDLYVGGPSHPNNWLPLSDDAVYINLREFVADWENDALAVLSIERLDDVGAPRNLTPADMIAALDRAARWVETSVSLWNEYANGTRAMTPVNEITPPGKRDGTALNMVLGGCQWDLAPHQVLLVELEQPEVTYWSIQNYVLEWLTPLDFANRVTSLNDGQLHVDDDGKVRVVVAHADPGVQNWLDTSGLRNGLVSYRYVRPETQPAPASQVIHIDDVRDHLPASTPVFSPDDRREQIAARRRGIARRFRR